ncbi:MFS transporter [Actinoalloteichus hymeniacidonis]|uniref:Multidrug efflux pump Tap n=1 Tax=Actinoalloteichus hymeniacidonis TaxID=340345 RepID=A0AAC9HSH9_9PSEU|nr:MFS transporter [Actinoalloteichus hymeniacidonis]AOS64555.1 arabinose efflux permease family protein [Actinoalloteichus hymeniacidonis]MBB5907373.1 MFS family permease [Actinoalloteichus hymeniacidonis]
MRRHAGIYLGSYGFSLLGKGIAGVIMPLLVLERTGDVLAAGLLATVTTAVSAVVGIFGGLLVDRVDRRRISIAGDLFSALSLTALPIVDAVWGLNLTWFLTLAVIGALFRVPGMTAHETLLPAMVRLGSGRKGALDRLVAIRETMSNVLLLAGPGVGGLFIGLFGLNPTLLLATAGTSLLAAAMTTVIDPRAGVIVRPAANTAEPAPARGAIRGAVHDLLAGWRFLGRSGIVLGTTLISSALVAAISSLQTTLMPAYFTSENLPALAGLTLSALAAGSIVGSLIFTTARGRVSRRTWFVIGMLGTLVGFAALGTMFSPWVVFGAAAFIGLTNAPVSAVLGILTIEATPDELRGRILGAQNALVLGAPALVTAPIAAIAAGVGLPAAGIVLAAITGITALIALVIPVFRSLDDVRAEDEPAVVDADPMEVAQAALNPPMVPSSVPEEPAAQEPSAEEQPGSSATEPAGAVR